MNRYESETNETLVDTAPLFSSVWLALFSTLRENYLGHRITTAGEKDETGMTNDR